MGKVEGDKFDFADWEKELREPPTDLWLRHLCVSDAMVSDFQKYLDKNIARGMSVLANLEGPGIYTDLAKVQGGIRALATIRKFVTDFQKEQSKASGRVGSSNGLRESDDAGHRKDTRTDPS